MTTGSSRYADISTLINDIREGAVFAARQQNLLVPTVTVFRDTMGMNPRKNSQYGTLAVRSLAEGEDRVASQFNRTALSTLTPASYGDQVLLTDQRLATDDQNVRADAAMEMSAAVSQAVDEAIADNFPSLTGGTIGSAGSTILWSSIIAARALAHGLKIPGPYWCALHPYQWNHLLQSALTDSTAQISNAPIFQDRLTSNYFMSTLFNDVFFVITPSVDVDSSDDATGAFYNRMAMAYDERKGFYIEPERDGSRESWELNYGLWYATGVWRPAFGIKLIGDAATPS